MAGGEIRIGPLRAAAILAVATLGAALALAPRADAFLYWNSGFGSDIGRGNLDGSGVDQGFLSAATSPCGVAVDASHVYWGNGAGGTTIGRANLDGTGVDQTFITGAVDPCGVAVDGSHVYWANFQGNSIGRANLDGTGVNQNFITANVDDPCGVAVNEDSIYWTDGGISIRRATIDGSSPNPNFITGIDGLCGPMAVNSAHIYFVASAAATPSASNTIARANLDGSALDEEFITASLDTCGVAVDDRHVYWGNLDTGNIGRANLEGSSPNPTFIAGGASTCGIAADALLRTTSTSASCSPAEVAVSQPTRCTATVTDTYNGPKTRPTGTVRFTSSSSHGSFGAGASCTLTPTGSARSSCSVTYAGPNTANLLALYRGDPSHDGSNGLARVRLGRFSLGAVTRNTRKATATVAVDVPGPGSVDLAGKKLGAATARAGAAGELTLPVALTPAVSKKITKRARKRGRRRASATVTANLTFAPSGGGQQGNESTQIKLVKRVKRKRR